MATEHMRPPVQAPTPQERVEQRRRLGIAARVLRAAGYRTRLVRDSHYLGERAIRIAPPRCPGTPLLAVRCRQWHDGHWRYEVLDGDIATSSAADLLEALDELFDVGRGRGESR